MKRCKQREPRCRSQSEWMFPGLAIRVDLKNRFDLLLDPSTMSKSNWVLEGLDRLKRQGSYAGFIEDNLLGIRKELTLDNNLNLGSALTDTRPYPFDIAKHLAGARSWISQQRKHQNRADCQ